MEKTDNSVILICLDNETDNRQLDRHCSKTFHGHKGFPFASPKHTGVISLFIS